MPAPASACCSPTPTTAPIAATSFYGKERAAFAETIQRTVAQLLKGLQQHVAADPPKW